MKLRLVLSAALFAAVAPVAAQAQVSPFSVEVRAGAAIPTGDWAKDDGETWVNTGYGFDVTAMYRVVPMFGVYGGFNYTSFGVKELSGADVNDSGFSVGLHVDVTDMGMMQPWFRVGGMFNQYQTKFGGASFTTDRGFGFEAAGGVAVPVTPMISITPGVSFRSHKPKFEGETSDEALSYLGLSIGGRVSF
jgi:hypothetical protein